MGAFNIPSETVDLFTANRVAHDDLKLVGRYMLVMDAIESHAERRGLVTRNKDGSVTYDSDAITLFKGVRIVNREVALRLIKDESYTLMGVRKTA